VLYSLLGGGWLRPPVLRAFAAEGTKFSLWFLTFLATFAVVRYFYDGEWVRGDTWEFVGAAAGLIATWSVSAARTISAAYLEFNESR